MRQHPCLVVIVVVVEIVVVIVVSVVPCVTSDIFLELFSIIGRRITNRSNFDKITLPLSSCVSLDRSIDSATDLDDEDDKDDVTLAITAMKIMNDTYFDVEIARFDNKQLFLII